MKGDIFIMSQDQISLDKRIFIISKAYGLIQSHFAHWQGVPDLDLDNIFMKYVNQILNSSSRFEFDLIMMEFLANLKNGHSWFVDKWLNRNYTGSIGFKFKPIEDKWVVIKSIIDEIHTGDIITKINNEDFQSFYEQKRKYINASSENGRKNKFTKRHYLFPQIFQLELNNNKHIEIIQNEYPISLLEDKNVSTIGHWIYENEQAYLKIPSFGQNYSQDKALEYIKEFFEAKMIIIDVRGNTGGSTPEKLISQLMNRPYRFWAESTNISISLFQFYYEYFKKFAQMDSSLEEKVDFFSMFHKPNFMWYSKKIPAKENAFQGKLCILIDKETGSAAEDFVIPFKDNNRAMIIGQTSMGSTGQPYIFSIDEDITIFIGTKRAYFPDGSPFEGIGITPDIEISPTVEDIINKVDRALDYSKELFKKSE